MDSTPYSNTQINQRLSLIRHLVDTSDLLLLVEGPVDSGKTTLATWLADTDSDTWACCLLSASAGMDAADLLAEANQQIDDFFENPESLTNVELRDKLFDLVKAGRTPVMIVDDAHTLSEDAMSALLELNEPLIRQGVHASAMRLILFCDATIEHSEPYRVLAETHPDAIHRMHPPRLQLDDISDYLEFKFRSSGFRGKLPFSEKELQTFFWQSEGMPGILNRLAQDALQNSSRTFNLSGDLFCKRNVGFVAAAFVAGIVLFSLGLFEESTVPTETISASGSPDEKLEIALPTPAEKQPPPKTSSSPVSIPLSAVEPLENPTKPVVETKPDVPVLTVIPKTEPRVKPAPAVAATPKPTGPTLLGKTWILNQQGDHYTLQLIAVSSKDVLLNLIPSSKTPELFASFETWPRGQSLHTLIYGSYANKEAAVVAAKQLPASLSQLKPWPRPFSSIQTLIDSAR